MLAIFIILAGIAARLIPHTANFSPVAAIALFSGAYLSRRYFWIVPLAIYILSDVFLGFHKVSLFCWASIIIIAILGQRLQKKRNIVNITAYSLLAAVLFFLITNFGVWAVGFYPRTLAGLGQSYLMGIPFFRISLAANLIFSLVIFGIYEFLDKRVKETQLRTVLFIKS